MGRQHVGDGFIRVTQQKTGAETEVPIHPKLAPTLAKIPAGQMQFLVTQDGVGFTAAGFGNIFRAAARAAGLHEVPAHGLRKAACTRLADAGATQAQIMAISGHKDSSQVKTYTAKRNQRHLAQSAMALIGGTDGEQKLAKGAHGLAKSARK